MFVHGRRHGSRRWSILFGLVMALLVLVSGIPSSCVADDPSSIAYANVTSRFILWGSDEKMIDPQFSLNLFYFNSSMNHTGWYRIHIDDDVYNDTFQGFVSIPFNYNMTEVIGFMEVEINNESVLTARGIVITEGVTAGSVRQGLKEFLISLSPFEWSKKEWHIFYAIITASLLSVLIAYRLVKRYRKFRGVKEIK